jgi:YihY family inner membrane protein
MQTLKARFEAFQRTRAGLFLKKVMDDQAPNLASLLAWGTLSAILPMLLGMLSLAGLVLRDPQTLDQVYRNVVSALPADATGPLSSVLDGMRQGSAAPAGIIALLLLLINGSSFFSNMASVFNQAYHVEGRMILIERAIGLGMLVVTTILIIATTLAAGLSSLVTNIPGVLPIGPVLGQVVGLAVPIVSVLLLFLLLYRVLPNAQQTWREVIPGTLVSTILLLAISELFPLYMKLFPPNHAYAVFGVFLVFTFWLYLVGLVFVLGAELNAFLEQPARSVALAEASIAAERGRADYDQETGKITAEASGHAPNQTGGGLLGAPRRSPREQVEQVPNKEQEPRQRQGTPPAPRRSGSLAGRVLGFAGLVFAAVLLRGREITEPDDRLAA